MSKSSSLPILCGNSEPLRAFFAGANARREWGYWTVQSVVERDYADVLELDRHFSEHLGINALRPEAKLLLILSQTGTLTIKQALSLSGLSYRGFYLLLNRLLAQGLIEVNGDHDDRRVRNVKLARSLL
jgi:hypothetical protein